MISNFNIFFGGKVPMVKLYGSRRSGLLLLVRPSLELQTPSPAMSMGIILRMCPTNMKGF